MLARFVALLKMAWLGACHHRIKSCFCFPSFLLANGYNLLLVTILLRNNALFNLSLQIHQKAYLFEFDFYSCSLENLP